MAITSVTKELHSACAVFLYENYAVKVSTYWLEQCLAFLVANLPERQALSSEKLCRSVADQFLFSDLETSTFPSVSSSLPPNAPEMHNKRLGHRCLVQLVSKMDVGAPAMQLMQENETGTSSSSSSASHRMYKFVISDGHREARAMEHHRIPQFDKAVRNGVKLLLSANVVVRGGVLLLDKDNTEVLGGSVDEWEETASEAYKKELKKRLGMVVVEEHIVVTDVDGPQPPRTPELRTPIKLGSPSYPIELE